MADSTRKRAKKQIAASRLLGNLEKCKLEPVYFFYAGDSGWGSGAKGEDPFNSYLLNLALNHIRRCVVESNTRDMNYNVFVASETPLQTAIEIASTYPMMREKRLVIVKDCHLARADDWKSAESYLADPSPTTCLVLIGEHFPKQNRGGRAAKQMLMEHAACVRFAPFSKAKDVQPYFSAELKKRGKQIERAAESMLYDLLGFNLREILLALDKLELFVDDRDLIRVADVEQCISRTRMEKVWSLQDSLAKRQLGPSLDNLTTLMENARTDDEIFLMGSLLRFFSDLLDIRGLLASGVRPNDIAAKLGGNQWAAGKKVEQAKGWSLPMLTMAIGWLQECDTALRSSRAAGHTHFERFVMRVCQGPAKGGNKPSSRRPVRR